MRKLIKKLRIELLLLLPLNKDYILNLKKKETKIFWEINSINLKKINLFNKLNLLKILYILLILFFSLIKYSKC